MKQNSKRMHYVLCCSASYLPAAIISITAVRRLLLVQQAWMPTTITVLIHCMYACMYMCACTCVCTYIHICVYV